MRKLYLACLLVLIVMVGGLFMASVRREEPVTLPTTIEGQYSNYEYRVLDLSSSQHSASFYPALKSDDLVVIGALQELMRSVYGDSLETAVQPVVEAREDKNYVTFSAVNAKTYFELFKNAKGEVGSVIFWRERAK